MVLKLRDIQTGKPKQVYTKKHHSQTFENEGQRKSKQI